MVRPKLLRVSKHVAAAALAGAYREDWSDPFAVARRKWGEVPSGNDARERAADLLRLSDAALLEHWEDARSRDTEGPGFGIRGWYHALYRDLVEGKLLLDVGSGLGFSTITFAEYGAKVTFVDVVEDNLKVVRRLCGLKDIDAQFCWVKSLKDFAALPHDFEIVTSLGSLINAPLRVTAEEVAAILPHVADHARWLHFAYPRSRWVRDGWPPFWAWGSMTDGRGTPWMEWHDRDKVLSLFQGVEVELLFECEWHGGDFNWFDLQIRRPG
jgi:SAM-dependent methyltransferase